VVLVTLQWLLRYGVPLVSPDAMFVAILGGVVGGLAIVVWWLFFSRAPWAERVGALGLMILAPIGTKLLVHESIAGGGMGMMIFFLVIPPLCLALVAWAWVSRRLAAVPRVAALLAAVLVSCGCFALLRTGGVSGNGGSDWHWRWTKTPEERLLERAVDAPVSRAGAASAALAPDPTVASEAEWPGFRGSERDGIVRGARIATDWSASPPVELWRRPIGPAWSSFAVRGNLFYTQEQRGENEIVACYELRTGVPVWTHADAVRFWESNAGAGPRATPTLHGGRVYTLGATGILNALDAATGAVVWSRDAAADTGKAVPGWGFSGSPLVVGDVVIVHAGVLVAYGLATGERRWLGPDRGGSYSSPHLVILDGVEQVLMSSGAGATSVVPADGKVLWEHDWPGGSIVQPALTADGDVLLNSIDMTGGVGVRRLAVKQGTDGWRLEERWTSKALKPYFNDFVVHGGHAFGFDGSILACIDLADGKRKWKGGRYGNGQLVLLPDEDLLLVLSEEGDLALVAAVPDAFTELARVPALEGKTWNHPVLVGDVLLVRNAEEMAAFRLSLAER
jgi:outer membrane protein assembly factor BamB